MRCSPLVGFGLHQPFCCATNRACMRLMIFKVNQLGDNVVFLPVVQALQRALPALEITVLTSPVAAPLYENCTPGVRVLTTPTIEFNSAWRSPARLFAYHRLVRDCRPDACLLADDQGSVAHLLARTSGAKIRVGGLQPRIKANKLLTHLVPLNFSEHISQQNWRIMLSLLQSLDPNHARMESSPPAPDLGPFCDKERERFVLVHPGASRAYKRWPSDRFVALANSLTAHVPVCYVRQGDEAESGLHDGVKRCSPSSLHEFVSLMNRAALFIGNNSGPMNIASALGVPGIIFCGPSTTNWDPAWHLDRFQLLRDPKLSCQPCDKLDHPVDRCQNMDSPMACMKRWAVEAVHERVLQHLALNFQRESS
jgi:ADP-heptose:LPS heptosyltransferase